MPDIPQIRLPMRIIGGQLATVEQGGPEDVRGQVLALIVTPPDWLTITDDSRDFGLADQAHLAGGPDLEEIDRQITDHVPDAHAVLDSDPAALADLLARLNVRVGA